MTKFIAVDGESVTYSETNDHHYVMMAASDGSSIVNIEELSTVDCFEYLLDLKERTGGVLVAFGLNYDVNMMLRDVGKSRIVELWQGGHTTWNRYNIEWLPSKYFRVSKGGRSAQVSDTFGFFQTSFVNALAAWDIDAPPQLDEMKAARSTFGPKDVDRVLEYCHGECTALVELMEALEASLRSVNLQVPSWIGAGAVAGALLRREGILDYVVSDDEYPEERRTAIRTAYFGGRTELFQQGEFEKLYGYDICSAYPWGMIELPSLQHGKWKYRKGKTVPCSELSVMRVKWEVDVDTLVMPFPYREKGRITYPSEGHGWYWKPEVELAIKQHGPKAVRVLESYEFVSTSTRRPFGFVPEIYEERRQLKAKGHAGQKSLKLAINALYGKLAQGAGWKGEPPPYRSYAWAGLITSKTRARVAEIALQDPESVVMICTDGIFFDKPQDLEESGELGGIEAGILENAMVAQAGIYEGAEPGGDSYVRSRGIFAREVRFAEIRKGYRKMGPVYRDVMNTRRFVGVGSCIVRRDFGDWRKWIDGERSMSLAPGFKSIESYSARPTRHLPPSGDTERISDVYVPKVGGVDVSGMVRWLLSIDSAAAEWIASEEQPLREGM